MSQLSAVLNNNRALLEGHFQKFMKENKNIVDKHDIEQIKHALINIHYGKDKAAAEKTIKEIKERPFDKTLEILITDALKLLDGIKPEEIKTKIPDDFTRDVNDLIDRAVAIEDSIATALRAHGKTESKLQKITSDLRVLATSIKKLFDTIKATYKVSHTNKSAITTLRGEVKKYQDSLTKLSIQFTTANKDTKQKYTKYKYKYLALKQQSL